MSQIWCRPLVPVLCIYCVVFCYHLSSRQITHDRWKFLSDRKLVKELPRHVDSNLFYVGVMCSALVCLVVALLSISWIHRALSDLASGGVRFGLCLAVLVWSIASPLVIGRLADRWAGKGFGRAAMVDELYLRTVEEPRSKRSDVPPEAADRLMSLKFANRLSQYTGFSVGLFAMFGVSSILLSAQQLTNNENATADDIRKAHELVQAFTVLVCCVAAQFALSMVRFRGALQVAEQCLEPCPALAGLFASEGWLVATYHSMLLAALALPGFFILNGTLAASRHEGIRLVADGAGVFKQAAFIATIIAPFVPQTASQLISALTKRT